MLMMVFLNQCMIRCPVFVGSALMLGLPVNLVYLG